MRERASESRSPRSLRFDELWVAAAPVCRARIVIYLIDIIAVNVWNVLGAE